MEKWRLRQEMTQIKDLAERYGHVLLSRKNNQCLYINGWMNATAIESIAEKQKIIDWDGQTDRRINELKIVKN